ncbi:MAG: malto-oligosyltrehalose synthase [Spirochaetales bacterium]
MDQLTSTYRLQFTPEFTFADALEIVPYLASLGISHIYASPIFAARPGSRHGYDVINPNEINPELGGREGFDALIQAAHQHGLGWIQDVVPNHMAYSPENALLYDLFENGEHSEYWDFFDIEWNSPFEGMERRVIAPFLGRLFGQVLEDGELSLSYDENGFRLNYYEMRFPLRIESYRFVLANDLPTIERELGRDHPDMLKLLGVMYTLESLAEESDRETRLDKNGFVKRMLWELYRDSEVIKRYVDQAIDTVNGRPSDPESYAGLNDLHWRQVYRLAFWKVAGEEINYRRFFSVNDLICMRVEDHAVFEYTHRLLFELVDEGSIDGLRIDHIDGLYEPGAYLERLRERIGEKPIYVEKILHHDESLPPHWPVQGTTGYDALHAVDSLFVEQEANKRILRHYRSFSGIRAEFAQLLAEHKRRFVQQNMTGDVENVARYMKRVVGHDRHGIDITNRSLSRALTEVMVHFPVYRSYVTDQFHRDRDRDYIRDAVAKARRALPEYGYELDYIESFLLLSYDEHVTAEVQQRWGDVVLRFQQFTGPAMAKGLEDTLMYGFAPLLVANEVGGNPMLLGADPSDFYAFAKRLEREYPESMTASSTHDTKRGEDTRMRLAAISHHFDEWVRLTKQWRTANRRFKVKVDGVPSPDPNDEYFIYQTMTSLVEPGGVEEALRERLGDYLLKSLREAKRHTGWLSPDERYEKAALSFLGRLLDQLVNRDSEFAEQFIRYVERVVATADELLVARAVLRLTMPGVPDTYQGTELYDLTLVDPDNRRPVDYERRKSLLASVGPAVDQRLAGLDSDRRHRKGPASSLPARGEQAKFAAVHLLLQLRRLRPELFVEGEFEPVAVEGPEHRSYVAFTRGDQELLVVVRCAPRLPDSGTPTRLRLPGTGNRRFHDLWSDRDLEIHDNGFELSAVEPVVVAARRD